MAEKEKVLAPLSPVAEAVLVALKAKPEGEIVANLRLEIEGVNSAHLTALKNRGLVVAEEVEIEVPTITKRTVLRYKAVAPVEAE